MDLNGTLVASTTRRLRAQDIVAGWDIAGIADQTRIEGEPIHLTTRNRRQTRFFDIMDRAAAQNAFASPMAIGDSSFGPIARQCWGRIGSSDRISWCGGMVPVFVVTGVGSPDRQLVGPKSMRIRTR
jgi:hypothetical protein